MSDLPEVTYKVVVGEDGKTVYIKIESTIEMSNDDVIAALECYIHEVSQATDELAHSPNFSIH